MRNPLSFLTGLLRRGGRDDGSKPMNRAERRAAQRAKDDGDRKQDNLRTLAENQAKVPAPVTGAVAAEPGTPHESVAGDTRMTGAGTGGAVESGGRLPQHEGMHLGNWPNS